MNVAEILKAQHNVEATNIEIERAKTAFAIACPDAEGHNPYDVAALATLLGKMTERIRFRVMINRCLKQPTDKLRESLEWLKSEAVAPSEKWYKTLGGGNDE